MATRTGTERSLALLDHLARVSRREAETCLGTDGLRPRHLVVLTLLRDHGAATQQSLAGALRLDPSNVVGVLNELERDDFVERRRDPADRRRHIVTLTDGGTAALDRAEQRLADVEETVLGALSGEERATLHALLLRAAGDPLPAGACVEASADDGDC